MITYSAIILLALACLLLSTPSARCQLLVFYALIYSFHAYQFLKQSRGYGRAAGSIDYGGDTEKVFILLTFLNSVSCCALKRFLSFYSALVFFFGLRWSMNYLQVLSPTCAMLSYFSALTWFFRLRWSRRYFKCYHLLVERRWKASSHPIQSSKYRWTAGAIQTIDRITSSSITTQITVNTVYD